MTNKEQWESALESWSVYQKAEKDIEELGELNEFKPKVVEDIPNALRLRRRTKFWSADALDLAEANPMKWIIAFDELIVDSETRSKVRASARSSMSHLQTRGLPIEARVITNQGRVQCYVKWITDSE
jgi:hypothetical protein|tara:strand:+ start:117 stop:497 length:381 start_codon:yes stop_codon:yes gene_type:complete